MPRHPNCVFRIGAIVLTMLGADGCSQEVRRPHYATSIVAQQNTVRPSPLLTHRVPLNKSDVLPAGDVIKQWRWDMPWEVHNTGGQVIRRMYSPEWSTAKPISDGPQITLIQDPRRGTIFEAFFVQSTDKVFDLPITLYFFSSRESNTPLFSLSFTDTTTEHCRSTRVSRGGTQQQPIPLSLIQSAEWIGVGWQTAMFEHC